MIMGEVLLRPPYTGDCCQLLAGGNESTLSRARKVVDGVRRQLSERRQASLRA